MTIEEICRRAKAEGLTYGQYVAKHRAELAGKRPTLKAREGAICCQHCGRGFVPSRNSQKYCRDSCRAAAGEKRRRARRRSEEWKKS